MPIFDKFLNNENENADKEEKGFINILKEDESVEEQKQQAEDEWFAMFKSGTDPVTIAKKNKDYVSDELKAEELEIEQAIEENTLENNSVDAETNALEQLFEELENNHEKQGADNDYDVEDSEEIFEDIETDEDSITVEIFETEQKEIENEVILSYELANEEDKREEENEDDNISVEIFESESSDTNEDVVFISYEYADGKILDASLKANEGVENDEKTVEELVKIVEKNAQKKISDETYTSNNAPTGIIINADLSWIDDLASKLEEKVYDEIYDTGNVTEAFNNIKAEAKWEESFNEASSKISKIIDDNKVKDSDMYKEAENINVKTENTFIEDNKENKSVDLNDIFTDKEENTDEWISGLKNDIAALADKLKKTEE